jgi:hypothetical protein
LSAVAGLVLVLVGGHAVAPPAAPLPARTFSDAGAPTGRAIPGRPPAGRPDRRIDYREASHLYIPSLRVAAAIVDDPSIGNELIGPGDIATVGRWTGGASLDAEAGPGTVDLAGHVNYAGKGDGALHDLYELTPGALIITTDAGASTTTWYVTALQVRAKDDLPTDLFTGEGPRTLKLITCGGALRHVAGSRGGYYTYADNIIVTARPADPQTSDAPQDRPNSRIPLW